LTLIRILKRNRHLYILFYFLRNFEMKMGFLALFGLDGWFLSCNEVSYDCIFKVQIFFVFIWPYGLHSWFKQIIWLLMNVQKWKRLIFIADFSPKKLEWKYFFWPLLGLSWPWLSNFNWLLYLSGISWNQEWFHVTFAFFVWFKMEMCFLTFVWPSRAL
jgi:hypothetical protein